ncbi:hypothetical protein BDN71DRAFT_1437989 [Pleurotus eryngii]|uniref:Uncharacterized protein n=1 Tax=Pleurotus eryngii TaxID=5323 RepID=A0A9P6AA18_PLEER|nr:hypothetical protein BDN71DRAFT_1437989 [Pleurotus eryngii]
MTGWVEYIHFHHIKYSFYGLSHSAARNIPRVSSEMRAQDPEFNWVICHPELDYKFDCERGDDWSHKHEEFDLVIGGTIG